MGLLVLVKRKLLTPSLKKSSGVRKMKSRSSFLSMNILFRRAEPVLPVCEKLPFMPSCIFQFWKLCTAVSVFSVGMTLPSRLSIFHWNTPMGRGTCFPRVVSRPHDEDFLLLLSWYSLSSLSYRWSSLWQDTERRAHEGRPTISMRENIVKSLFNVIGVGGS